MWSTIKWCLPLNISEKKMFQQSKLHYLGKSHRQHVLFRESLQKDLSVFDQKKDFLTSEKPGNGLLKICFQMYKSRQGKYLSSTFSMHYGTKLRVFQFQFLHRLNITWPRGDTKFLL